MAHINPGDAVRLSTIFTDAAGVVADPTTVTLRVRPPGVAETVYVYLTDAELIKDSTGNYHLDYVVPATTTAEATFHYQWEGTGAVQAVEPGTFLVENDYLLPTSGTLVTLEEAQTRGDASITQDMIDEVEEGWTAVIGPLTGERTETFYLSERRSRDRTVDGLYLSRRTDAVTVTNATTGEAATTLVEGTDYRFINNLLVERIPLGATWLDVIEVTYTPNDEETVRSVIFDTLSYRQTPAGTQSIRIGEFSQTFFQAVNQDPALGILLGRILPAAGLGMTSPFRYAGDRRDRTLISTGGS